MYKHLARRKLLSIVTPSSVNVSIYHHHYRNVAAAATTRNRPNLHFPPMTATKRFFHGHCVCNESTKGNDKINVASTTATSSPLPLNVDSAIITSYSSNEKSGKTTFFVNRNMSSSHGGSGSGSDNSDGFKTDKYKMRSSKQIIDCALQKPAGPLYNDNSFDDDELVEWKDGNGDGDENDGDENQQTTTLIKPGHSDFFIPEVCLHDGDGRNRSRVLV